MSRRSWTVREQLDPFPILIEMAPSGDVPITIRKFNGPDACTTLRTSIAELRYILKGAEKMLNEERGRNLEMERRS